MISSIGPDRLNCKHRTELITKVEYKVQLNYFHLTAVRGNILQANGLGGGRIILKRRLGRIIRKARQNTFRIPA